MLVLTTLATLALGGYLALLLGYSPSTPGELRAAQQRVDELSAQNAELRTQAVAVQTELAQMSRQAGLDREDQDALAEQVQSFAEIGDVVATRLVADARERATLATEMRSSRDAVVAFATAEAERAALIAELRRRSERVERFLQRLSDISEDTALDLGGATPTLAASPTPEPSATPPPSPTPEPTLTPTAAPTARASATPRPTTATTPTLTPTAAP